MEHGLFRLIAELTKRLRATSVTISETCSCIVTKGLSASGVLRSARALSASGATTRINGFLSEKIAYFRRKGCIASTAEAICGVTHVFNQG